MGVVYRAWQPSLGRQVAVKRLFQTGDPRAEGRFNREIRALARVEHPHLVKIFTSGSEGEFWFYAMELVEGATLAGVHERLGKASPRPETVDFLTWQQTVSSVCAEARRAEKPLSDPPPGIAPVTDAPGSPGTAGPMPHFGYARQVAELGRQVAEAAHALHEAGILHRDIKPGNILVNAEGTQAMLMDLGLAQIADEVQGKLTRTRQFVGTLRYASPEQVLAVGGLDRRSDVYNLGATLWELLTFRPLFGATGATPTPELMRRIQVEEVERPRKYHPGLSRDLEAIVLRCLEKDPRQRYATAAELARDLDRYQRGEPVRARPVRGLERSWKWVKRRPVLAGLTAALLLVTVLGGAGIVWKYFEAEQQKNVALREADKAKKARDFLVSIFRISETDIQGGNIIARQILAFAEKRIPAEFEHQPELRKELEAAIEEVKQNIERTIPAAMILAARGGVRLHSARGVSRPAVPQVLLFPDDRLTLAADAAARLVFLSDFHQEQIQWETETTISRKGCEPATAVSQRDNGLLMTFVRLPKGTFYMGWDGEKKGVKTEIKEDFEIAVHTVTQGQWQAVMGNNPSWFSRRGNGGNDVLNISDEELKLFPVETVSWNDAQEFIKRLNEKGRARGYLYRLPTEAEWEYACRGGATSEEECSYHFYFDKPTNDLSSEQANFSGAVPFGNAPKGRFLQRPTRVGAYPPNKLGLCDMHGNVWQWCGDLFHPGGGPDRIDRGGSWSSDGSICRAAIRNGVAPADRCNDLGFRLARVPVR
jgi:formylglycine-generating enzyme required for sulfatase activity/serine/threonine protein kinase